MSPAPERDGAQRAWESFVSERDLFISVYGLSYGNEPETRKAEIREGMKGYVEYYIQSLDLKPDDVVMDFGSGVGIMADIMAPKVRKIYAVDVSKNHLAYISANVDNLDKIEPVHIAYSAIEDIPSVTKIYAANVLIHFNIFDLVIHIEKFAKLLPPGGRVVFNICDYDHLVLQEQPMFQDFLAAYRQSLTSSWLVHWHSAKAVLKIADGYGFDAAIGLTLDQGNTHLSLVKR